MKIRSLIFVSLFAALVAVLGYVPAIPLPFTPVPITLQTLGVMLAGGILGARLGSLSMLILISLAAIGAPVLAGGSGGLGHLLGPTGGYIFGWAIAAFVIGALVERFWTRLNIIKLFIFNVLGGIVVVYAVGIPYLAFVTELSIPVAIMSNLAYIPGDLIKAFIAAVIVMRLKDAYPIIKPRSLNK